ncbi:MAG: ATP synthase F1 subunit delta [Candidatus Kapabacteria bacterium]|nr:ATP synthase F1 subunit delta [Candidatus Kapabacteria bacterium]MDW8012160.1 ATP synthase F1 subunit delta [Bacteroidota bacterium]
MSPLRIARRYATALLRLAQEGSLHAQVYEELCWLRDLLRRSSELRAFLRNPVIRAERKRAVVTELFAGRLTPLLLQFLLLLVDKRREALLPEIITAYEELYFQYTDRLAVTVRSAIPLETPLQNRLVEALQERTGKTIVPIFAVDPTLIGGVQLQIGDTVIDGSLRHALERLRRDLHQKAPTRWLRSNGETSPLTDHKP